jgi:hypothetical protein
MADPIGKTTRLRVRRGSVGEAGRYDVFDVPYEEGMSVLDALRWIRIHLDSTLGIRYAGERRGGIYLHRQGNAGIDHCRTAAEAAADSGSDNGHFGGRREGLKNRS